MLSELFHGPLHPIKLILKSKMDSSVEEAFKTWHYLHKRDYGLNSEEGKIRFENFKKNFNIINKHNIKEVKSYSLGLNNFADMTLGEFHEKYLFNNKIFFHNNIKRQNKENTFTKSNNNNHQIDSKEKFFNLFWNTPDEDEEEFTTSNIKSRSLKFLESNNVKINNKDTNNSTTSYKSVNWILQSYINQYVEDQEGCGSCWAFSAVQSIQAAYAIKTNKLEKFSKQQLVDCDEKSDGCNGGFPHYAMEYIKKNGILKEKDYPYKENMTEKYKKNCILKKIISDGENNHNNKEVLKIKDFEFCDNEECRNDQDLFNMLERGPLSAVVDASEEFMLYENGVYDKPCKEQNHAILIVGFHRAEKDGEQSYWIVKNSWGFLWGDHGYIRIKQSNDYNSCLLNQYYLRPILE